MTVDASSTNAKRGAILAAALWYTVVLSVAAKTARVIGVALSARSLEPVVIAPLALGLDLVVAALLGGALVFSGRLVPTRLAALVTALVLLPWAFLVGMNVMSYRLTGTGITLQRLRGDEGATLADLELLSRSDLTLSLVVMAVAALLLPALYLLCRRFAVLQGVTRPLAPALIAGLGLLLLGVERLVDPATYGLASNDLVVLAESLSESDARVSDDSAGLDAQGWRELHRPSRPVGGRHALSVRDVPLKNVVVVLAEGVPHRYTSFGAGGKDSTPNLRRRAAREGVVFDRFYAHYHSSIQSIFSLVCSAYPPLYIREGTVAAQRPRIDCGELSEQLERGGRSAGLFHGGRFAYYDKLALLGGRGYDATLDAEALRERYPRRKTHKWGIDDRAVVDATLEWIDSLPEGQPFGALLIPITAHYPYWIPKDVEPRFPGDERPDEFASAVAFLDEAFEQLVRGLEERGLYDDTLVVYLADHGEKVDPFTHVHNGHRAHYQQSLHVPLVLLNPRLFPAEGGPRRSERTGGIVDVMPTILDALDLPADPRHFGQSLISPDWEPRRVFFGSVASGSMLSGFVEGDTKLALRVKDRSVELYDLAADPLEQNNLAEQQAARAKALADDALRFYLANQVYFLETPSLPDEKDVQQRLLEAAELVVVGEGGERTACVRAGSELRCPGLDDEEGPTLRLKKLRVDRRVSECVEARLPAAGQRLELTLRGEALGLVSGARLGVPDDDKRGAKGQLDFSVTVDDEAPETARLKARAKLKWLQLRTPREKLRVTVSRSSDEGPKRACLIFSDVAWRSVKRPASLNEESLELRH